MLYYSVEIYNPFFSHCDPWWLYQLPPCSKTNPNTVNHYFDSHRHTNCLGTHYFDIHYLDIHYINNCPLSPYTHNFHYCNDCYSCFWLILKNFLCRLLGCLIRVYGMGPRVRVLGSKEGFLFSRDRFLVSICHHAIKPSSRFGKRSDLGRCGGRNISRLSGRTLLLFSPRTFLKWSCSGANLPSLAQKSPSTFCLWGYLVGLIQLFIFLK